MIDSHTHIFDERFDGDRAAALDRALEAGVDRFILPATLPCEYPALLAVVGEDPRYIATMGLHPIAMNDNPDFRDDLMLVREYLEHPPVRFVAIGEVGLDLHWQTDFLDDQIKAFEYQIELAIEFDLPLILHVRDAWEYVFDIMEPYKGRIRGVFHSFSGSVEHVQKIEALGGFLYGINGTVTYKKSLLAEVLPMIPMEKIVLETDSPYLPPDGHRGDRNESAYIPIIAAKIAQIKEITIEEVDRITTENTIKLFNL